MPQLRHYFVTFIVDMRKHKLGLIIPISYTYYISLLLPSISSSHYYHICSWVFHVKGLIVCNIVFLRHVCHWMHSLVHKQTWWLCFLWWHANSSETRPFVVLCSAEANLLVIPFKTTVFSWVTGRVWYFTSAEDTKRLSGLCWKAV